MPSPSDRRARVARLTRTGLRERANLEQRSDRRARSLLDPLSPEQRERLVAAMREVERLLVATSVEIRPVDPECPDAAFCLAEYVTELNHRSSRPFDPNVGATAHPDEVRPPAGQFFVVYVHGEPMGCGAVKHHVGEPAEIKRMWIAPGARGLGLGRRLLETLEACARDGGAQLAHIETSGVLNEAWRTRLDRVGRGAPVQRRAVRRPLARKGIGADARGVNGDEPSNMNVARVRFLPLPSSSSSQRRPVADRHKSQSGSAGGGGSGNRGSLVRSHPRLGERCEGRFGNLSGRAKRE